MSGSERFISEKLFMNVEENACVKIYKPKAAEFKGVANSRPQSVNFNFIAAVLSDEYLLLQIEDNL